MIGKLEVAKVVDLTGLTQDQLNLNLANYIVKIISLIENPEILKSLKNKCPVRSDGVCV